MKKEKQSLLYVIASRLNWLVERICALLVGIMVMVIRTARITGICYLIISSASILSWWMTFMQIPQKLRHFSFFYQIPEDVLPKIFIPFFTTRSEGSGIGLSLSHQIMRLHGGNIRVKSEPETSTVFSLSF